MEYEARLRRTCFSRHPSTGNPPSLPASLQRSSAELPTRLLSGMIDKGVEPGEILMPVGSPDLRATQFQRIFQACLHYDPRWLSDILPKLRADYQERRRLLENEHDERLRERVHALARKKLVRHTALLSLLATVSMILAVACVHFNFHSPGAMASLALCGAAHTLIYSGIVVPHQYSSIRFSLTCFLHVVFITNSLSIVMLVFYIIDIAADLGDVMWMKGVGVAGGAVVGWLGGLYLSNVLHSSDT